MMSDADGPASGNRLLASFPNAVSHRLAPHVEALSLPHGLVVARPGEPLDHVWFLDRGLASVVKTMGDGRTAEVGAIGIEGMIGAEALIGTGPPAFETIVQVDGYGRRIRLDALQREVERSHAVKALVLRYISYWENELGQIAACNRLHTLRQRCCRWILMACDNAGTTTFTLTHEFLALMMGVNRPSLSLLLASLQERGVIEYRRASLTIGNRRAVEEAACECYAALREASEGIFRAL
jgi:CRP-like cAMP-binding protein